MKTGIIAQLLFTYRIFDFLPEPEIQAMKSRFLCGASTKNFTLIARIKVQKFRIERFFLLSKQKLSERITSLLMKFYSNR